MQPKQTSPTDIASLPSESAQPVVSDPQGTYVRWEPTILLFGAFFPSLITYIYFCHFAQSPSVNQLWVYGITKTLLFSLPIVWVGWIGRERFPWGSAAWETWIQAIAFGLAVVGAMFGFYFLSKSSLPELAALEAGVQEKIRGLGMATPLRYFGLAAFYSVCHSFLEEYYWRWFFHHRLRSWLPFAMALLVSSLSFALHHVIVLGTLMGWGSALPYLLSATVAVGGAVWATLYERSGSLLPSWLSHAIVDGGIFWLGALISARTW